MLEVVGLGIHTYWTSSSSDQKDCFYYYVIARLNGGAAYLMEWSPEISFFSVIGELVWGLLEDASGKMSGNE